MTCEALLYKDEMKDQWDTFIAQAKNVNFIFLRDYMDYHRDRFNDHSIMFIIDGKLIACLPANRVDNILHSHQGLTYGGLVMHRDIRQSHAFILVSTLKVHMARNGIDELVYKPAPYIYHALPSDEDIEALVKLGGRVTETRATCAIKIGRRPPFSSNRRHAMKQFMQTALTVSRAYDFRAFMTLTAAYLWRKFSALAVHTPDEMEQLAARFPDSIRLYAVYNGAEIIAGIIVYCNANCAKVQYASQNKMAESLGVLTALYAHVLDRELQPNSWIEFGHSVDPFGLVNEGVHRYKESLGARTVQIREYRLKIDPFKFIMTVA